MYILYIGGRLRGEGGAGEGDVCSVGGGDAVGGATFLASRAHGDFRSSSSRRQNRESAFLSILSRRMICTTYVCVCVCKDVRRRERISLVCRERLTRTARERAESFSRGRTILSSRCAREKVSEK